ncbi:MAG: SPFH domain-containing protein [Planctomycetota bacterium]|nr:SPFH domain-containing protein [Planctomycetota bacterium]MDG2143759.1 SPFH domain-containing protein [Planctomycetota bacterium]
MKLVKIIGSLFGLLLVTMIASALLMENVPPTHVGVKQNQWGGGVVEEDYSTGYHLGITGIHKWYLLDRRTHFLTFADSHGTGNSSQERPSLEIRTRDGNMASIDATLTYRIKEGEAHLMVSEGLRSVYRDRVISTVESVLLEQLAELTSEDFYSTETRLARAEATLPELTKALASLHVVPEVILLRAVSFPKGYEQRLQDKQLTHQKKLLATAQQKVEAELLTTGSMEKEIEAAEKELRGTWDKQLQVKKSDNEVAIAKIYGDADLYSQRNRSEALADYETMIAEGNLATDRAEALRNELRNKALDTQGGAIFLAQQAAENLNITTVTLNSNDPNVPTVLDLDGLVELLIGSGE